MSKKANIADLEASLKEINGLIEKMEHEDQTLEQSLGHFEQGITLIKNCQQILREAEQKVQILIQNSSNSEGAAEELKPYASEGNGDSP